MAALLIAPAASRAESLDEALASAYTTNAALAAQQAGLRATDELVPEALGNWRPTIKLNGDIGRDDLRTNVSPPVFGVTAQHAVSPSDYGVTISEPLYRGGRTQAQTEQAEATIKAQRELLVVTEQSVLLNAIVAYMDVVQAQALVDVNANNEQVLRRQFDASKERFRVGELTRTDTSESDAAVSGAHASLVQAQGALQNAIASYIAIIGHPPKDLKAAPPTQDLPKSLEDANNAALATNPAVLAQRYAYEAAQHGVDLAAGELLPTVSLIGSYNRVFQEQIANSYAENAEALINVSVPIYQQGAEYARIRQQKHTAAEQRLQLDETRRDTIQSTTQAWERLSSAHARVLSLKDQVGASKVALEGIERESTVGSRTVLDVLTTEQNLLAAEVNLVEAQHDETVASYQLRGAIGQLTAQALKLPVEIYDPTKHYQSVHDQWIGAGAGQDDDGQGK
jgi:outer membrane protein